MPVGQKAGLKGIDYPSKERGAQSSHGGPLASRKGPQTLWTVQEGPTGCAKSPGPVGQTPCLSASCPHLREGRREVLRPGSSCLSSRSARTTSVAQLQESRQTGGQRARGSPSVPYFPPAPLAPASASQLDALWGRPRALWPWGC